jgi:hypothetical protein
MRPAFLTLLGLSLACGAPSQLAAPTELEPAPAEETLEPAHRDAGADPEHEAALERALGQELRAAEESSSLESEHPRQAASIAAGLSDDASEPHAETRSREAAAAFRVADRSFASATRFERLLRSAEIASDQALRPAIEPLRQLVRGYDAVIGLSVPRWSFEAYRRRAAAIDALVRALRDAAANDSARRSWLSSTARLFECRVRHELSRAMSHDDATDEETSRAVRAHFDRIDAAQCETIERIRATGPLDPFDPIEAL